MYDPILFLSDFTDISGTITDAYLTEKNQCEVLKFKDQFGRNYTACRYPKNKNGERKIVVTQVTAHK